MKFAGLITVIISTCTVGVTMYDNSRKRLLICRELVLFCNSLKRDFMYRATPINLLIEQVIDDSNLIHIKRFVQTVLSGEKPPMFPLTNSENKEVVSFLNALGKSDRKTQIALVESFCDYISKEEELHRKSHTKNARLYLSFGVFSGVLIALVFV
ncbi:MAG: stage III sporulation protein AB [Eubacterium sp.]|nr:stage III sporulation protein AB [Eubacterium sp.]MBQ8980914.1 stage III sporulation protein AB [Eubacterium sp.]MBR1531951.1 stage III sporulation protein AB [Eubacterium sp.]MBR2279069.1 stage III sporulation protein AB [Eubacterium sp.]